jgi:hypothetical protein
MNDTRQYPYATFLNVLYPPLSVVDVPALVAACTERWYNQTLCKVNDSVVRLGVLQGEYHWHKHDSDDEFFFVLDGRFFIDLEDRSVELGERQGFVVPKGVVQSHARPGARNRSDGRDRRHRAHWRRVGPLPGCRASIIGTTREEGEHASRHLHRRGRRRAGGCVLRPGARPRHRGAA